MIITCALGFHEKCLIKNSVNTHHMYLVLTGQTSRLYVESYRYAHSELCSESGAGRREAEWLHGQ